MVWMMRRARRRLGWRRGVEMAALLRQTGRGACGRGRLGRIGAGGERRGGGAGQWSSCAGWRGQGGEGRAGRMGVGGEREWWRVDGGALGPAERRREVGERRFLWLNLVVGQANALEAARAVR